MIKESFKVELKRAITEDLKKEVLAFANSDSGIIYIGIDDDGEIIGLDDIENEITRVTNMIRDSIKPDVTMFIRYEIIEIKNRNVLKINVNSGNKKPYYIYKKGLKPSGVYIRQGLSAVPASDDNIKRMIKESDGESYEKMRSANQELTFDLFTKEFMMRKLPMTETNMINFGLITKNEKLFTNLGLLLSDQAEHTIKVALFQGNDKSIFRDRKEFSGSVLKQLENVYDYLDIYNKERGEIKGLHRSDNFDYPKVAIREALLNSIIHREYSLSGSILISIFDNRIEMVTIGGLISGIAIDDILLGISQTRNEKLAHIFYRLKLVEAYGTGISKIVKSYSNKDISPIFEATNNAFKVTLFNTNYFVEVGNLNDSEKVVLRALESQEKIMRKDVEIVLDVSQTMAGRIIKGLVNKEVIIKRGSGLHTYYIKKNKF